MRTSLTQREFLAAILGGGIASGFVFSLSLGADSSGILFVGLPLLLVGLALGAAQAGLATFIACLTCGILTGFSGAVFFAMFMAFPVYYFLQRTLLWREGDGRQREWYPMLRLLSELSILAVAVFMLISILTRDKGGLQLLVPHSMGASFKNTDPDLAALMQRFTGELSYVFLALVGWVWIMTLYGFAVLANFVLKLRLSALRPSLAIGQRGIPASLLGLLLLSAVLALTGAPDDRFIAQIAFLIMLLPYLLSGLAFVHAFSVRRGVAFRRSWIACFYIALIFIGWPILAVIATGLYLQLSELLDSRKKIG